DHDRIMMNQTDMIVKRFDLFYFCAKRRQWSAKRTSGSGASQGEHDSDDDDHVVECVGKRRSAPGPATYSSRNRVSCPLKILRARNLARPGGTTAPVGSPVHYPALACRAARRLRPVTVSFQPLSIAASISESGSFAGVRSPSSDNIHSFLESSKPAV